MYIYLFMLIFMQTVSEFVAIVPVFVLAFWTCFAGETFELMAQEVWFSILHLDAQGLNVSLLMLLDHAGSISQLSFTCDNLHMYWIYHVTIHMSPLRIKSPRSPRIRCRTFYFHVETRQTTWEDPSELIMGQLALEVQESETMGWPAEQTHQF